MNPTPLKTSILKLAIPLIEQNDEICDATKKMYYLQASKFGTKFFDAMTCNHMIKKLNEEFDSPSSKLAGIHILLLVSKDTRPRLYKKLREYQQKLIIHKDELIKEKNVDKLNDLPSFEYLEEKLNEFDENGKSLCYVLNYLLMYHGFRNKEFEKMKLVENKKEFYKIMINKSKTHNSIYINTKNGTVSLFIEIYKTAKHYGNKLIEINNPTFVKNMKKIRIGVDNYLFRKQDGSSCSCSYVSDRVAVYSIDNLREGNIFKIAVKNLIDKKDFTQLEKLSSDRGSSLTTIMKTYNIQRINKCPEYDFFLNKSEDKESHIEPVAEPKSIKLENNDIDELPH